MMLKGGCFPIFRHWVTGRYKLASGIVAILQPNLYIDFAPSALPVQLTRSMGIFDYAPTCSADLAALNRNPH